MSNENLNKITDQQTITSMEIADLLGKNHFDVLKAIRKMEPAWEKVAASKFTCSSYKDESGKKSLIFILIKTECLKKHDFLPMIERQQVQPQNS